MKKKKKGFQVVCQTCEFKGSVFRNWKRGLPGAIKLRDKHRNETTEVSRGAIHKHVVRIKDAEE